MEVEPGIDIFFTEKEIKYRKKVRTFVEKEITPYVDYYEENDEYPYDLMKKIGQAGYMGQLHSTELGGTDLGLSYEIIVAEEISAVFPALDMSRMASASLFGLPLRNFGTGEQKQRFLPGIISGDKIGAIGITEPDVGSDTAGMKTRAVKEGDEWVINGEKRYITNGNVADYICLFAITNPGVHSHNGMTAFIVETKKMDGFEPIRDYKMLGMRGARVSHFKVENVRVPEENIVGKVNEGFRVLMNELNGERIAIAAEALGYAQTCYEHAVHYSVQRKQFGREIRMFEGVSFKVAEMATKLEAARLLTLLAARLVDEGYEATKHATMAKVFATEAAIEIADKALQIHGGEGYTKDQPIERFLRDARLMTIGGGTAEILRFLIQREVYKEFGYGKKRRS
ncbi:MAG: acyl-CoA dehydrogenase family protein [Candidatus Heimdallarchaeota archaeon]